MTEPQVWTLISVFAAALLGILGFLMTVFTRSIKSEFDSVRADIGSLRVEMNARLDSVSTRIDYLDRDVQLLMKREFGENQS